MEYDPILTALGTAPIPGDTPVGQPARYEPEYEAMQAEIDKLRGLDGAVPDWTLVADNATTVLGTKSKDLLVASYLCAALWERRGWAGLADGLNLIKGLCATFWEGLQPAKLRVRRSAVDWLLERIGVALESAPVVDADRSAMEACRSIIDELVAFGETRWENDAPAIWSLGKAIGGRMPAEPVAVEAAGDSAVSSSAPAASVSAPVATQTMVVMAAGAPAGRAEAYRSIQAAADVLQAIEPHSPVPYLLRRALTWGSLPLPALYAELQRAGTVWDLVLQGEAAAASPQPIAVQPMVAPVAAVPTPTPVPEAAPAAPSRPRGDY